MLDFDTYYHLFNHANGMDNLFVERKNYLFFLSKWQQHISPIAETLTWCLMPNHFHFLVKIRSKEEMEKLFKGKVEVSLSPILTNWEETFPTTPFPNATFPKFKTLEKFKALEKSNPTPTVDEKFLSKQFANLFSSYTQSFNKVNQRRGSLFLKNFKRKEIKDDDYLRAIILYIHLNPVKHHFTTGINDWEWTGNSDFYNRNTALAEHLLNNKETYNELHLLKEKQFEEYAQLEQELTL